MNHGAKTMTDQPWVDEYRPEKLSDVQGNNQDLDEIANWADDWSPGDDPLLLVGPPGVGKTSTAEAVANRLDLQTVEVNASSARTTDDLKEIAAQIRSVGADGHRLILIDEVDSWHHAADKQVLYDSLDAPGNPAVMTANDDYEVAGGLKSRARDFEFSLGVRSRKAKLREIAESEGVSLTDNDLSALADRSDLRSAINDLQAMAGTDTTPGSDTRTWETSEWDMLDAVLSGTPDIGDISPPDALMWLDECVSREYRGLEMAMAYESLAMADVQLGRAQDLGYGYWKHARALVEEVARIRQTEPYYDDGVGYQSKGFPEWFRHSAPRYDGDTAEARLYRALKKPDEAGFEFEGDFPMFLRTHLPILEGLGDEAKYRLIQRYRLDPQTYEALDVTESEYQDWLEVEAPEAGEWEPKAQDATEW